MSPEPPRHPDAPQRVDAGSGSIHGPVLMTGPVAGDVNLVAANVEPPRPVNFTAPPRIVDREDVVRAVLDAVDAGAASVTWMTLHGEEGVGTSAVGLAALHTIAQRETATPRFPGGLLDVRPGDVGVAEALRDALRKFGIAGEDIPRRTADRIEQLHFETRQEKGAVAILVDGAQSWNEVLPFVPAAAGSLVLVAARQALEPPLPDDMAEIDGALRGRCRHVEWRPYSVGPLPEADAVAMLEQAAQASWTLPHHRQLAARVCEIAGRKPSALRAYGRWIWKLDNHHSTGGVPAIERFTEGLSARPGEIGDGAHAEATAYLAELSPETTALALRLANHPEAPFAADLAHRLADAPAEQAETWLRELVSGGLLDLVAEDEADPDPPVRYSFHSPRIHAALRARSGGESTAVDTILAHYLDLAHAAHHVLLPGRRIGDPGADHPTGTVVPMRFGPVQAERSEQTAMRRLDHERLALTAVVLDAVHKHGRVRVAYRLCVALWAYWFPNGLMREIVDTHDAVLGAAADALTSGERAQLLLQRSIAWRRDRDLFSAAKDADRAVELAENATETPLVLHSALEARGDVHLDADEPADAIRLFTRSLEIARGLTPPYPRAVLNLTHKLGRAFLAAGDTDAARHHLYQAERDVRALDHDDPQNLARITTSLGDLAWTNGDRAGADTHWERARRIHHANGHLRRAAEINEKRADTLHAADPDAARAELEAALQLYAQLGAVIPLRRITRRLENLDATRD